MLASTADVRTEKVRLLHVTWSSAGVRAEQVTCNSLTPYGPRFSPRRPPSGTEQEKKRGAAGELRIAEGNAHFLCPPHTAALICCISASDRGWTKGCWRVTS